MVESLKKERDQILQIAERYGVSNVRVFGSIVRGESGEDNDVDLLAEFGPRFTLLKQAAMTRELESVIGRKADMVSARALRPRVPESALKEALPL